MVTRNESNARLDESLSSRTLSKTLTGNSNVTIDTSRISISPTGQVQPASSGGSGNAGASDAGSGTSQSVSPDRS